MVFKSYYEAAYHLQHLSADSDELPDAIIGYYDQKTIREARQFGSFLNREEKLLGIPFILIDQKPAPTVPIKPEPVPGIDDIVRGSISSEELYNKIALLKKFKSLKQAHFRMNPGGKQDISKDWKIVYDLDHIFKRVLDILVSVTTLLFLAPFMLLIAIIIKIESRGPVFYKSFRAGSNYRIFKFIKFRSMVADADQRLSALKGLNQYGTVGKKDPVFFKISNDPRTTRFGKFLRNTSLDELPQLFNVIKGDMSLVGNRPLPLYEAKTLTTDRHVERFIAPAGITGLWQVSKRGKKEMSVDERVALDIDYARNHSFWYDLKIIMITPKALTQKESV
jgi:lipopolysaccharide/colanic/teichoic acid biosynthesis glycosyltransferase